MMMDGLCLLQLHVIIDQNYIKNQNETDRKNCCITAEETSVGGRGELINILNYC